MSGLGYNTCVLPSTGWVASGSNLSPTRHFNMQRNGQLFGISSCGFIIGRDLGEAATLYVVQLASRWMFFCPPIVESVQRMFLCLLLFAKPTSVPRTTAGLLPVYGSEADVFRFRRNDWLGSKQGTER